MYLNAHYREQIGRFARLFIVAFAGTHVLATGHVTTDAVVGAVIAAVETVYREVNPTTGNPTPNS